MPPIPVRVLLALVPLLAGGCRQDDPQPVPPSIVEAFPHLPLPPGASFVGRSGGEDALTLKLASSQSYEAVLRFYRQTFAAAPWQLRSDVAGSPEGRVLYAERDGRPIWIRLQPAGPRATLVEMSGAAVRPATDSATPPPAAADSAR